MKKQMAFVSFVVLLCLLCGCAISPVRTIFYTRTASDEEAFPQHLPNVGEAYFDLDDNPVPLAPLPSIPEDDANWLLVKYEQNEDGSVTPVIYHILNEDHTWSEESYKFEDTQITLQVTLPDTNP